MFVKQLGRALGYPVALDATGRVADGYGVAVQPWFVLSRWPSGSCEPGMCLRG
jgi:hypothetical protein